MTVLIGWIGVDSHSPCSAYILSDSRLSWGTSPSAYNFGRKLFSLKNSPDILGTVAMPYFQVKFFHKSPKWTNTICYSKIT